MFPYKMSFISDPQIAKQVICNGFKVQFNPAFLNLFDFWI